MPVHPSVGSTLPVGVSLRQAFPSASGGRHAEIVPPSPLLKAAWQVQAVPFGSLGQSLSCAHSRVQTALWLGRSPVQAASEAQAVWSPPPSPPGQSVPEIGRAHV